MTEYKVKPLNAGKSRVIADWVQIRQQSSLEKTPTKDGPAAEATLRGSMFPNPQSSYNAVSLHFKRLKGLKAPLAEFLIIKPWHKL